MPTICWVGLWVYVRFSSVVFTLKWVREFVGFFIFVRVFCVHHYLQSFFLLLFIVQHPPIAHLLFEFDVWRVYNPDGFFNGLMTRYEKLLYYQAHALFNHRRTEREKRRHWFDRENRKHLFAHSLIGFYSETCDYYSFIQRMCMGSFEVKWHFNSAYQYRYNYLCTIELSVS